jgi:ATP-dependent protease HslVU (ClpYQ) peptidase subunit
MTCIIALEHEGKVYMGGDSAAVSGWDIQKTANHKVFSIGEFLIGYTSSFRMGQLLQYHLDIPENNQGDDLQYLITKFIPAVRQCLKDGSYTKIENNQESAGFFLIGYHGRAYKVCSDFQVLRVMNGFLAIGIGEQYALGALAAMDINQKPEQAIERALEIAGKFNIGVCEPYYVISTQGA